MLITMARRKIDKQALASLIRESKELSNDQKSDLLQLLNEQKRYGLVWEQHKEDAEELLKENIPVLVEDASKRIISSPRDKACANEKNQVHLDSREQPRLGEANCQEGVSPNHILIEGDNLHALTALTYTHEGKVDVIYIDPPYNTGNKDFVYNDSYVDSEDGYRHSKWLSFMEKRLRIAKRLLSDRGVIFISIDDFEQPGLNLLCNEVFGENNFQGNITWRRRTNQPNDKSKMIARVAEYILVYSKNDAYLSKNKCFHGVPLSDKRKSEYKNPDNDQNGPWSTNPWKAATGRGGCSYSIITPTGIVYDETWYGTEESFLKAKEEGRVHWTDKGNGYPRIKIYLKDVEKEGQAAINFMNCDIFGSNQEGSAELEYIMGKKGVFDNPKPTRLIKSLEHIATDCNSTILDFFAGSGTTLHATMQLNAEDGGHRQCILVTNNENNICEEVTYERNKRVINGYTTPKGVEVPGLTNNNLRYYKTAFVPREKTAANRHALMNLSTDLLCIKENMYNEQPFEIDGKKMKPEFVRYFVSDIKDMVIIYDPRAVSFVAKALPQDSQKKIMVYVYSDGQYAYNDEFRGKNIELCALPDAIYQALSRVLPPPLLSPEGEDEIPSRDNNIIENSNFNTSPRGGQEGVL